MPAMRLPSAIALAAAATCMPATAAISSATPSGFLITHAVEVRAGARAAYQAIGQVGRWWSPEHTYSGSAANMRLDLTAGGCFCESWSTGSVEHARVIYAVTGKAVRLEGALGPLQQMAVNGILHFAIAEREGATAITMTYRVRGDPEAGLDKVAAIVDKVMVEQLQRLAAYLER